LETLNINDIDHIDTGFYLGRQSGQFEYDINNRKALLLR